MAGSAAQERAEAKREYYHEGCRSAGWDFSPCVVETTGAWGSTAQASINKVARRIAVTSGIPTKQVAAEIWTDASMVIARSVGVSLARCAPQVGNSFSVGTYAPISSQISVSATGSFNHLPRSSMSVSHAGPSSEPALFTHQPYASSSLLLPRAPHHLTSLGQPSAVVLADDPRSLGPRCMHLPSGSVHPLRPPVSRAHVASNAELGLRDPPGPVSLLACERAGARVDLRA